VRIVGIDCPESRTSDRIEKVFGEAAKQRLTSLLSSEATLISQISKMGENMKGKFGRILGDFKTINDQVISTTLMEEGHAVAYNGGDKEAVQAQHLKNRQRLIDEGKVPTPDGMTLTPNKVNTFKATKPPLRKKKNKKK
jgi:endonuclease YncB( thermonuclease family)